MFACRTRVNDKQTPSKYCLVPLSFHVSLLGAASLPVRASFDVGDDEDYDVLCH